jgi:hypothetical protein
MFKYAHHGEAHGLRVVCCPHITACAQLPSGAGWNSACLFEYIYVQVM